MYLTFSQKITMLINMRVSSIKLKLYLGISYKLWGNALNVFVRIYLSYFILQL